MQLTQNALEVLKRRYLDENETPEEMMERVAKAISKNDEEFYGPFLEMLQNLEFVPGSPTLANAGLGHGSFTSCFVLPISDSMDGIMTAVSQAAKIFQSGGGVGYSFSNLRPRGSSVSSGKGVASGPIDFMRMFDTMCDVVKQGGMRRGAQMSILRVDHPDIIEFINCKQDLTKYTNCNISVHATEQFMAALNTGTKKFYLHNNYTKTSEKVDAEEIFNIIVTAAWTTGDPGLVFIDRVNDLDPIGNIESCNPCGEEFLPSFDSCNLGSIDLSKLVIYNTFNFKRFKELINLGIRFLDNVITENKYPLPQIDEVSKANRRLGLSVMGFADCLIKLGIRYDSNECLNFIDSIGSIFKEKTTSASEALAEERGAFPNQKYSKIRNDLPIRNVNRTTIVPSGTVSIIAGTSSSLEPLFAIAFERVHDLMSGKRLTEFHPEFKKIISNLGLDESTVIKEIFKCKGSIQNIENLPQDVKDLFRTAHDITPEWHVRIQAQWQKYIDNAISKTINMASEATKEDVATVYKLAYKLGCKGVTVFRDGCRGGQQVLTTVKDERHPKKRPDELKGFTRRVKTEFGNMYVTVNEEDGKPFEVFADIGKSGSVVLASAETVGRLVSLALRSDISVRAIVEQLKGIGGGQPVFEKGRVIKSIADGVAYVLEMKYLDKKVEIKDIKPPLFNGCDDCM